MRCFQNQFRSEERICIMGRLFAHRATVCRPERLFEELEERIVLDASVDASLSDAPHHGADVAAHWNLEYSSDPSAHMNHVLDTADLGAYPGDLALAPPPSFNAAQMGPIIPAVPGGVADLSGAVRILGTTATDMVVVVDYNPLQASENAIKSLTFTTNANSGVTITQPGSGITASTWQIEGPVDGVNAVLATMQANISSTATAAGHFMVSVTDADYADATTRANSAFVIQNFYIPVTTSGGGTTTTTNNPAIPTQPSEIDLTLVDTAGGTPLFQGANLVTIADTATPMVDVGIRVAYGVLAGPAAPTGVQIIQSPPASGLATPPGAPGGTDWTAGWMYIRGNVDYVNEYLQDLTYRRFSTHGTLADGVIDDYITISVDDRGTNGNAPWWGNPVNRVSSLTLPIYYLS
jgi:hypothetical protein